MCGELDRDGSNKVFAFYCLFYITLFFKDILGFIKYGEGDKSNGEGVIPNSLRLNMFLVHIK